MNAEDLRSQLRQFTGTAGYTRLLAKVILTDGAVYLGGFKSEVQHPGLVLG